MDRIDGIKEALNYVMMLRGLPYHTREWVESMLGYGWERMVEESVPEVLKDDSNFLAYCREAFLERCKKSGLEISC